MPLVAASSARFATKTTGNPRSRHASAIGRWRARSPASPTTMIASGWMSTRSRQNCSPPAGLSRRESVPGKSTRMASPSAAWIGRRSVATVVPGALTVSAKRPVATPKSVDLPTFGRPTSATTGRSACSGGTARCHLTADHLSRRLRQQPRPGSPWRRFEPEPTSSAPGGRSADRQGQDAALR